MVSPSRARNWVPLREERACAACGLRTRPMLAELSKGASLTAVIVVVGGFRGADLTGPRLHAGFGPQCPACRMRPPVVVAAPPAAETAGSDGVTFDGPKTGPT